VGTLSARLGVALERLMVAIATKKAVRFNMAVSLVAMRNTYILVEGADAQVHAAPLGSRGH
jgi:hypothetical protein